MARIPKERRVDPIGYTPIADSDGRPTSFFARQWQNLIDLVRSVIELQDDSESNAQRITAIEDTNITAGVGLTGGGRIGDGDMTIDADVQALLDGISNTHGSVLFRGSAAWQALGPGVVDYVLATKGPGADPEWVVQSGGSGGGSDGPQWYKGIGYRVPFITATATGGSIGAPSAALQANPVNSFFWTNGTGRAITFDFGQNVNLTGFLIAQSNSTSQGTWQMSYSDDDISYTNVGSTFAWGGAPFTTHEFDNSVSARYWRATLVSGNTSSSPYVSWFAFKVDWAPA